MNPNRTLTSHTTWCAHDHRCNLTEHRSPHITVNLPGPGRTTLTRVRTANGREHAEIRITLALPTQEPAARARLRALLAALTALTGPARRKDNLP